MRTPSQASSNCCCETGYDVTASSAYEDAKRILSKRTYDLFVTDVRLRSFNGLNLVKKVRQEAPETAVIIMTGYDEPLMQLEASRYSAQFSRSRSSRRSSSKPCGAAFGAFGASGAGRASACSAASA